MNFTFHFEFDGQYNTVKPFNVPSNDNSVFSYANKTGIFESHDNSQNI